MTCIIRRSSCIFVRIVSEPFFEAFTLNLKYKNKVKGAFIDMPEVLLHFGVSTDIASLFSISEFVVFETLFDRAFVLLFFIVMWLLGLSGFFFFRVGES